MPPRPPSLPPSSFFVNLKSSLSIPSSYLDNNHLFLKLIPRKSTLGISRAKMWQTVRLFRVGGCLLARLKILGFMVKTYKQTGRQSETVEGLLLSSELVRRVGEFEPGEHWSPFGHIWGGFLFRGAFDISLDHVSCFGW